MKKKMLSGRDACFFGLVILIEIITYTTSFLISGLAKKDIFNLLEGKETTLGIASPFALILLNTAIPLVINLVKQINAGLKAKAESRMRKNVRLGLLSHVLDQKLTDEKSWKYGETISLYRNECEDLVSCRMEYYYQLPRLTLSAAILIVMLQVNPLFAAISLIPAFLILFLLRLLDSRILAWREKARRSTADVTGFLENVFGHMEYFRLIMGREKMEELFRERCKDRADREIRDRLLDGVLSVISENSSAFVLGIVLLTALPLFQNGQLSVGELVMFEYYYAFLASLPDSVGRLIRRHRQAEVAKWRLETVHGGGPLEEQENLTYTSRSLRISVDGPQGRICLSARPGESVLISGGGETDRSRMLQRLFQLCADQLSAVPAAFVPVSPALFQISIRDNICFGESFSRERLDQVMEMTGLKEDFEKDPDEIGRNAGKMGAALSGGQKKRIGIARALYICLSRRNRSASVKKDNREMPYLLFIDGLAEAVDERTGNLLISRILNRPDSIVIAASDSEKLRRCMAHILEVKNC
ncbi:MAG TPA: ABC transporter ATP-binding protein/permease [Candidatus Eisenbergiella merdipullorum]|uniref:ABC transporter ATP-binding protein/permease n=1 Tax=Candidatus Eisenbergiella merdipullorum TaxID=2838553 RepID=A0A9D2L0Q7_9FIRM|nr:ABC transporter ATP-binding protein/permease [Candidatus Eisenbergiella merdipullorum]